MDLLSTKEIYFNEKEHQRVFYGGKLVWSKHKGEFSLDLKNVDNTTELEDWYGRYEEQGRLVV